VQTPAIVVGVRAFKEADRMVDLLTPGHGRVTALARNARRSVRRFGGALDVGNRIEASLRPPRGGLWGLDEATVIDGRKSAHGDLDRLALLAYATEVCGRLAREAHPEPKLFGLLDVAATLLDAMTSPPSRQFQLGVESKALTFAGITPMLRCCATCGEASSVPMVIVAHAGGAHHAACIPGGGRAVSLEWLAAAEAARRSPLKDSVSAHAPLGPQWALAEGIEAHIGGRLKSRRVLSALTDPSTAATR